MQLHSIVPQCLHLVKTSCYKHIASECKQTGRALSLEIPRFSSAFTRVSAAKVLIAVGRRVQGLEVKFSGPMYRKWPQKHLQFITFYSNIFISVVIRDFSEGDVIFITMLVYCIEFQSKINTVLCGQMAAYVLCPTFELILRRNNAIVTIMQLSCGYCLLFSVLQLTHFSYVHLIQVYLPIVSAIDRVIST